METSSQIKAYLDETAQVLMKVVLNFGDVLICQEILTQIYQVGQEVRN